MTFCKPQHECSTIEHNDSKCGAAVGLKRLQRTRPNWYSPTPWSIDSSKTPQRFNRFECNAQWSTHHFTHISIISTASVHFLRAKLRCAVLSSLLIRWKRTNMQFPIAKRSGGANHNQNRQPRREGQGVHDYTAAARISNGAKAPLATLSIFCSHHGFFALPWPPLCAACGYLAFINWLQYFDKSTFVCQSTGAIWWLERERVCLCVICFASFFPSLSLSAFWLVAIWLVRRLLCTEIITGFILDGCARSTTFIIVCLLSLSFLLLPRTPRTPERSFVYRAQFPLTTPSASFLLHNFFSLVRALVHLFIVFTIFR